MRTKHKQTVDVSGTLFLGTAPPEKRFRACSTPYRASLAFSPFVLLFVLALFPDSNVLQFEGVYPIL